MFITVFSQTENNPNVLPCCWWSLLRSVIAQNCREVNLLVAAPPVNGEQEPVDKYSQLPVLPSFRQEYQFLEALVSNLNNKPLYWISHQNQLTFLTSLPPGIIPQTN